MTAENPAERRQFPGISPRAYEHPADRGALVALRSVPGLPAVLRALSGAVGERRERLLLLASAVKVTPRQFSTVHELRLECAATLDVGPAPEVFVLRNPDPIAMTIGMDTPFLVLSTGLIDLLDTDGLRFTIGHEMGHVLSGHAVYRTLLLHLTSASLNLAWFPIGYWGLRAIQLALEEWYRKSELSCDRAGLLCGQDPAAALRTHALLAGATSTDPEELAEFVAQSREYDAATDIRDSILKLGHLAGRAHPLPALRAAELQRWAAGEEYAARLRGDYPRRADDPDASFAAEVKAAAGAYRDAVASSKDPLAKLVTAAGGAVADGLSRLRRP
ncbi:M48 family metallopeptidase [Cryptosporangium aurantiacum]|uniref:Zn-dependent protease with chaperone function n=1 Tax=Cryptosporangium aurantiacum TaxID=134849 RepID=A0A1M7RIH5_9ACTN|nr:M48 family metallopeptidase [Cryptosporangium aurantiacum]SHN45959.1 Zn-dependent protease with chaperone function [Cryptosporangium aurantiacum]